MLENTRNVKTHTGNGVTTVFPYDFLIDDEDYAEVTLLEIATGVVTILDLGDFSIDGIGVAEGGNVTYNPGTPLASTHKINIRRVVPLVQNMDINNQTGFLPDVLEDQLDLMVMQIQQVSEKADRAVTVEIGSGQDPQALIAGVLTALEDTQAAAAAAAASELAAAASETAAEIAKDDAETAVASIGTSVSDAASSASAALASEIAAGLSEDAASASEIAAAASESAAAGSASTASTAADTATTKAGEASASADAAALAETAAEAAQAAAEAAAGGLTAVEVQINAAADTAFADADMLTARKDSDGSLIKRSWANVKAALKTYFDTLYATLAAATTSAAGIVELATAAEALTGTDATRAVTPAGLYFPTGHLYGLTLSNNGTDAANDIDIAAGTARDASDTVNMVLASALTKQVDAAWAVGSGNGGLDTGSIADTTYHIWLIKRSDTGVVDALFSTSASSPTMPSNYDYKRRIGSIVRTGGEIKAFTQNGNVFTWSTFAIDVNAVNPGTSAVTRTLTVPVGIVVRASVVIGLYSTSSPFAGLVSSLAVTDQAPQALGTASLTAPGNIGNAFAGTNWNFIPVTVQTNTSGQVRSRLSASAASDRLGIITEGWIDARGTE